MTDHELEAALRRVMRPVPRPEHDAERVVDRLASMPLPPQRRAFAWPAVLTNLDFAPAWPRLAALAGAAVLGIAIGFSGVGTRIATDLEIVRVAAADDGANVFDVDFATGLRP
jgi:hypothetical protein